MSGDDATQQNVEGPLGHKDEPSVKDIREGKAKKKPYTQTYEQGSGNKTPPHD